MGAINSSMSKPCHCQPLARCFDESEDHFPVSRFAPIGIYDVVDAHPRMASRQSWMVDPQEARRNSGSHGARPTPPLETTRILRGE